MSTQDHDEQSEYRDQWCGRPVVASPTTRPSVTVHAGGAPSNTRVDAPTNVDLSVNKTLPWVALACSFGFLGFGAAISVALMSRGQIEAEGRAVRAEVRAEFAQQLAALHADVDVAKYEASIAKNTSQKLEIKLNERR